MSENMKYGKEVTLCEILDARERRAALQASLLTDYGVTLVSFTMNIAGPIKNTPLIERAFEYGLKKLVECLPKEKILFENWVSDVCGCEAFLAIDLDAETVKQMCVNVEEESRLGRLFDMDVIDRNGKKLDRVQERSCIVCGKAGRECAAGRLHSVDQIVRVTNKIMAEHFLSEDAYALGNLASECLIREVETTPKPGLVDLRNCGSHTDMDANTFRESAIALKPYFSECLKIGVECAALSPTVTFDKLRAAGLAAEATMYRSTGGVNTHKGAIYSFGILLGALGRLWSAEKPIADISLLLGEAALLVKKSAATDLSLANGATAGEKLYLERGLTGIRGEVASGFESVIKYSLPAYDSEIKKGASVNDAGVSALLSLISSVEDTNLYHRGGESGARFAREYAKDLISRGYTLGDVEKMDDAFIERRLSPGGSADLLAVTYFIASLRIYK